MTYQVANFLNAESVCLTYGGHLASITDEDKFNFLNVVTGSIVLWTGGVFVGLNDIESEGKEYILLSNKAENPCLLEDEKIGSVLQFTW